MSVQPGSRIEAKPHLRAVPDRGAPVTGSRKFAPPRFPADLVGLDAQALWLAALARHEVAVVQAPAGYGKTAWCAALFAEAQAGGWRTAWLSLDADDNDGSAAGLLFDALALARIDADLPASEVAAAIADHIDGADVPFLLVLDDVDRLTDRHMFGILEQLMRYPPLQLRLVLSGRAQPGLAVGDADGRGMVLRIGHAELALDDADVRLFLDRAGASLDVEHIAALNRFLLGWPAGIRLAAQRPGQLAVMAATDEWDALANGIGTLLAPWVGTLPDPLGRLALRCAVAPWIDAILCGLLHGDKDSGAMLRDLSARGFFLDPADDAGRYRLHPAIRAALMRRLDADEPGRAVQLHRVAARYYAEQGEVGDAIDQAFACGDLDEAAVLVAGVAMPMVERGMLDRAARWIGQLPPALTATSPELGRAGAWLSVLQAERVLPTDLSNVDDAPALDLLRRAHADDRPDETVEACDQLLVAPGNLSGFAADMVRATLAHGAVRRGLFGLVHDAVRPLMIRGARRPLDVPGALAICAKAAVSRAQGQLGEAERLLREGQGRRAGAGVASALIDAALARACYERGALDAAAALAAGALVHLERSVFQDGLIHAFLVAIRVAAGTGQADKAASLIDRAELIAFARGWAPLKALCIVERARLRLPQTIDAEAVVAIADEEAAVLDPLSAQGRAFALLSEMRAYEAIAAGDRPRLTTVAERLLRLASNGDDAELRAAATLLNILPQLSGRCDKMVDLQTVRFLNHAASVGFRRTIVDVLDVTGVRAVQNFCSEAYASDCFLALLRLAEPSRRNPALEGSYSAAPGEAFSFLTEREIEILSALNVGESNKEIARTLHLAPETVKWHLKNVMRKLRAGSREEAVANAATLGLKLIEARAGP